MKYLIYRILCVPTGKSYVGFTSDYKARKRKHLNYLRLGKHHSTYLQNAVVTHGAKSLKWLIVTDNIRDKSLVLEAEIKWIEHFDSFYNGYNMTLGGESPSNRVKTVWNGVEYSSRTECAKSLGLSLQGLRRRLDLGYTSDSDMWINSRDVTWNGVVYKGLEEAATANGVSLTCMSSRIDRGMNCDDDVSEVAKSCSWNGVKYPSVSSAARANGITHQSMSYRIRKGYTCDDDLTQS